MTITVYWCDERNIHLENPKPVMQNIETKYKNNEFLYCPAVKKQYKNTFSVVSPIDYNIEWTGDMFLSDMYDQEFFDDHITPRDNSTGVFSLKLPNIYFVPDKPCLIELCHPSHGRGDLSRKTQMIEGIFDSHRHPRKIEASTTFLKPDMIKIKENDDLFYIRFRTEEKIVFRKFIASEEIIKYVNMPLHYNRHFTKKIKSLSWWYNVSRNRSTTSQFIQHAKNNLC